MANSELGSLLGPLENLVGIWEGDKGTDLSPDDDPQETEVNKYRERMVFEALAPVNNHQQTLYGLKYTVTAWRIGEDTSFHEEHGFLLWDPSEKQVIKSLMIPRGLVVLAGGAAEPKAKSFEVEASVGSITYGICSNKFLDREFKTVKYEYKMKFLDENSFSYDQNTQLQIKDQKEIFNHRDKNTLKRVKG